MEGKPAHHKPGEPYVIFQWPNRYLWTIIISLGITYFATGYLFAFARATYFIAAVIWSFEEITKGVNWFRKLLGLVVILIVLFDLMSLILGR